MLDFSHIPQPYPNATVEVFTGSATAAGQQWTQWTKPRGKGMVDILLIGKGGNGGAGVQATIQGSTGGGGGGSGGITRLTMPLHLLPDTLSISLAGIGTGTLASYIALGPKLTAGAGAPVVNDTLIYANGGGVGGDGTNGGGGGAGGAAGAIATVGNMPLGWAYAKVLAGVAGTAGGASGAAGVALTLPATGQFVTGGTGGGSPPAVGVAGLAGGSITGAGKLPTIVGGAGGGATTPGGDGSPGFQVIPTLCYWYGGTGGGSTFGDASGAGVAAGAGNNGSYGCGGGGGGAAHVSLANGTGVPGVGGLGGPAICIITCW
jgi:hypothetical protein